MKGLRNQLVVLVRHLPPGSKSGGNDSKVYYEQDVRISLRRVFKVDSFMG